MSESECLLSVCNSLTWKPELSKGRSRYQRSLCSEPSTPGSRCALKSRMTQRKEGKKERRFTGGQVGNCSSYCDGVDNVATGPVDRSGVASESVFLEVCDGK